MSGKCKSPYWSGCLYKSRDGYIRFSSGPNKNRLLHRIMMEQKIGRKLGNNEIVHHINEDKEDNNFDNLKILSRSKHSGMHNKGRKHTKKAKYKMSHANKNLTSGSNHYKWITIPAETIIDALGKLKTRKKVAKYLDIDEETLRNKMIYYGIYKNGTVKNIKLIKIVSAINNTNCISNAAKELSIDRVTLKNKLKKYNLTYEVVKNAKIKQDAELEEMAAEDIRKMIDEL